MFTVWFQCRKFPFSLYGCIVLMMALEMVSQVSAALSVPSDISSIFLFTYTPDEYQTYIKQKRFN